MHIKMIEDALVTSGYEEWTVINESVLRCPHGHRIEMDGDCPEGCKSPLKQEGLI